MRNIRSFMLAFALIAAGALLAAGCKQPGGSAGDNGGGTTAPGGDGKQGGTDNKDVKKGTVSATMNFYGELVGINETTGRKERYIVTLSLSDNKVGASAEMVGTGYFFIGKGDYDAEGGEASITLTDVKGNSEAITLTANYEAASKTLVVTEFAGNSEKQLLARQQKASDVGMRRYNAMVDLPVVGETYLSLMYNNRHATVSIAIGKAGAGGSIGTTRAYYGTGIVHRNKLSAKVEIERGRRTFVITAKVADDLTLSEVKVGLEGSDAEYGHVYENGDPQNMLPLFTKACFTLNSESVVTDIYGAGSAGAFGNMQAKLVLYAEPLVRSPTDPTKVATAAEAAGRGYVPCGYRMSAQFIGFASNANSETINSEKVQRDVFFLTGTTTPDPNYTSGAYTFKFDGGSDFKNGATYDNIKLVIKNWVPKTEGATKANVVSGEYTIELDKNGATDGYIPAVDHAGVKVVDVCGSAAVKKSDGTYYHPKVNTGLAASDICIQTGDGAASSKQARHLFLFREGFQARNYR